MNRTALVVAILGLALVACRGDDDTTNPGVDGGSGTDSTIPGGEVTIQEVQAAAMAPGTEVTIKGVVVTAVDTFGNRTGDFFVQEPGGGEFSGIKVFGAPLDQVAGIAPGDIVDITGAQKDEFALSDDSTGKTVTELKPITGGTMTVTKISTGDVPAPAVVDAAAISTMTLAERDAEWEKWEGVLIKVTGARQIAAIRTFGSNPGPDSTEFRITGVARVQSMLAELPDTSVFGVCYESITGVGDYFFNWIVAPRSAADLVTGGTACLPLADSVVAIQSSATTPEVVSLTDVVVTALDDIGTNKGFWVADELQGAANNGVYVYTGNTMPIPTGIVVGARVDVQGAVDEFDLGSMGNAPVGDTVTEIVNVLLANIVAPSALPTPATTAAVATLNKIDAVGEPWEGVLVQIGPVKVTNANAGSGKVELTDNNGDKILADDESFAFSPIGAPVAVNTCYATFTGVMHVQVNDDVRTINPRSLADLVVGTGCN